MPSFDNQNNVNAQHRISEKKNKFIRLFKGKKLY